MGRLIQSCKDLLILHFVENKGMKDTQCTLAFKYVETHCMASGEFCSPKGKSDAYRVKGQKFKISCEMFFIFCLFIFLICGIGAEISKKFVNGS